MRAGGNALVAVCAALVIICAGTAYGVNASAKVPAIFSLALDSSSVDFGSVKQGEWKEAPHPAHDYVNKVICQTNTGLPWTLSIKADEPLWSESNILPLENLKWMTTYAGNILSSATYLDGLVYPPEEGFQSFTASNVVIFRSSNASAMMSNNSLPGAEIQFKYAIFIPDTIKVTPGSYSTRVVYTMTE